MIFTIFNQGLSPGPTNIKLLATGGMRGTCEGSLANGTKRRGGWKHGAIAVYQLVEQYSPILTNQKDSPGCFPAD